MAEAIFKDLLSQGGTAEQWKVESAGTWGMDGYRAASRARFALQKLGLSAEEHEARTVTRDLLFPFDLILTMEKGHQEALRLEFPQEASRIFLLAEMVGARFDIQDPIGGSQVEFDTTAEELRVLLSQAMENITQLALKYAAIRNESGNQTGRKSSVTQENVGYGAEDE